MHTPSCAPGVPQRTLAVASARRPARAASGAIEPLEEGRRRSVSGTASELPDCHARLRLKTIQLIQLYNSLAVPKQRLIHRRRASMQLLLTFNTSLVMHSSGC